MRHQRLFVSMSALPLAVAGLLAIWQGSLAFKYERSDGVLWLAFGLVTLVAALLVVLRVTWAFILEGLVGLLVGAWFGIVLLFSILFMGDPEVGSPNLNTLVYFAELIVGLAASGWMVRAAMTGWRGRAMPTSSTPERR